MLVNFARYSTLLLLTYACGMPHNEIADGGAEALAHDADAEQEGHIYRLELSKVADIAVGEKFYVSAMIKDCAGQVSNSDAAEAEITLHIRDGDEYSQLATVKANEGAARFYVVMQKAGSNYMLQAEAEIGGETIATLSGPFNALADNSSTSSDTEVER